MRNIRYQKGKAGYEQKPDCVYYDGYDKGGDARLMGTMVTPNLNKLAGEGIKFN